jgi:hypothetical protein
LQHIEEGISSIFRVDGPLEGIVTDRLRVLDVIFIFKRICRRLEFIHSFSSMNFWTPRTGAVFAKHPLTRYSLHRIKQEQAKKKVKICSAEKSLATPS